MTEGFSIWSASCAVRPFQRDRWANAERLSEPISGAVSPAIHRAVPTARRADKTGEGDEHTDRPLTRLGISAPSSEPQDDAIVRSTHSPACAIHTHPSLEANILRRNQRDSLSPHTAGGTIVSTSNAANRGLSSLHRSQVARPKASPLSPTGARLDTLPSGHGT